MSADHKLQRALDEVEHLKEALKVEREAKAEVVRAVRRAEKQKGDLLSAFKKQLRLINILKRQKIHIEAAKLLSFSEEEFNKVLDMEL